MPRKKQAKNPNVVDAGNAETEIYVPSPEVAEEFIEAQRFGSPVAQRIPEDRSDVNLNSPILAGGDVDAASDVGDVGDEAVSGSASTPGQDVVEELGRALGVNYDDNEPLRGAEKISDRDRDRWELNPASSEGYRKRSNNEGEYEGD
jgi:hypothetical protein